ncbi:MAG: hypothetical protein JST87_05665 [Bacteroidetes bacterium]|nr:hypothetical protein [Bacteroidota bacterium]MBS1935947.1 hypothetical protein [Bacteroidota bacterium]
MKRLILALFFMSNHTISIGQINKFDSLANEMFFNIFIYKPDTSVFDFVQKYFPGFTKPFKQGHWTIYPPGPPPELEYTVHSIKFKKHPYFDAKFREGKLDILASEEKGGRPGVTDFQLWFMFDNKPDAQNAFDMLSKMFDTLSKSKKIFQKNDKTVAEYCDKTIFNEATSVEFILTNDELQDDKYKIFFRLGSFTYSN